MAEEEQQNEEQEQVEKKPSKLLMNLIMVAAVVLVPAILGLLTFKFILMPALDTGEEEVVTEVVDTISAEVVIVDFDEAQATVNAGANTVPPVLIYKVALACANAETAQLILARKSWFTSMIGKLHRNRTESELSDPIIQESILKQVKQEANRLLKKFAPDDAMQVIQVMHVKYAIFPL